MTSVGRPMTRLMTIPAVWLSNSAMLERLAREGAPRRGRVSGGEGWTRGTCAHGGGLRTGWGLGLVRIGGVMEYT